jgi:hypothetical protein
VLRPTVVAITRMKIMLVAIRNRFGFISQSFSFNNFIFVDKEIKAALLAVDYIKDTASLSFYSILSNDSYSSFSRFFSETLSGMNLTTTVFYFFFIAASV